MNLKVGDRVEFIGNEIIDGNKFLVNGATGTVVHIYGEGNNRIGVEWDEGRQELCPNNLVMFHSCNLHCKSGYGWYVNEKDLARIEGTKIQEQEIQIETDDLFSLF